MCVATASDGGSIGSGMKSGMGASCERYTLASTKSVIGTKECARGESLILDGTR